MALESFIQNCTLLGLAVEQTRQKVERRPGRHSTLAFFHAVRHVSPLSAPPEGMTNQKPKEK